MKKPLPEELNDAFDWTWAAGELDELASLTGEALETYARESAHNCRENGDRTVTEGDLLDLAEWLRGQAKR